MFTKEKSLPSIGLVKNTNMVAVSLFWKTNVVDVTSRGNALLCLRQTANVNIHHVTKFTLHLPFTLHYNYT